MHPLYVFYVVDGLRNFTWNRLDPGQTGLMPKPADKSL